MIKQVVLLVLFSMLLSNDYSENSFRATTITGSNILLIIADDLGADKYGLLNPTSISIPNTPIIDSLANVGTLFINAWAQPICSPTRASIMTGLQPYQHLVGHPSSRDTLASSYTTIAELISSENYKSGIFGKWHLGESLVSRPLNQGWEKFGGLLDGALLGSETYCEWPKAIDAESEMTTNAYATNDVIDEALRWIQEKESLSENWFATLAFQNPHTPIHIPPGVVANVDDTAEDAFNYMVSYMDAAIGGLLDSIPQSTMENTIIIFIGDNGTDHRIIYGDNPCAFNKHKATIYRKGVHVPFIVTDGAAYKGGTSRIIQGSTSKLIHVIDLFATIGSIAGVASPGNGTQSISMEDFLVGNSGDTRPIFLSQYFNSLLCASTISNGIYKLNFHREKTMGGDQDSIEFFNTSIDPNEANNIDSNSITPNEEIILNQLWTIMKNNADPEPGVEYTDTIPPFKSPLICELVEALEITDCDFEVKPLLYTNSTGNGKWFDMWNWKRNKIPDRYDNVAVIANDVSINANLSAECNRLNLQNNASLLLKTNAHLSVRE